MSAKGRQHWQRVASATLMRHARLLNLAGDEDTSPAALPAEPRAIAVELSTELVERACRAESEGIRAAEAIERAINRELWNALKPFRRHHPPATTT